VNAVPETDFHMIHPSSFADFFRALWDRAPFDWQSRLLERVANQGWPSTLDLPTGAGKTATLDVAVFALALDAARPSGERKQARRIVLVVDRRVVVDQAFERAGTIAKKLDEAKTGILADVAKALRALSGNPDGLPVLPAILRGGMPRESEWAQSPSQPVILTSTVDQVGSRLLFRGYGVSERMRSLHAGLLGCDTLFLLDEVHLARPFEETLSAITQFYAQRQSNRFTRPIQFVRMSATVASPSEDTFGLSQLDRENPTLSARLRAQKSALLRQVNTPRDAGKAAEALAKAAVREVEHLSKGKARALAVIVNRVETAKTIAALARNGLSAEWRVSLLTGRMRPLDRLDKQATILEHVLAGRTRSESSPKLLLVSTQAIEAGADVDFDALVTECASLDALRQRFGRLDRMGDLGATEAVILAGSSSVDERAEPDPIYADALRATWGFLCGAAQGSTERDGPVVDFGIDAMNRLLEGASNEQRLTLVAPRSVAPILTSSHIERWVQTSPAPHADPEVGPFLHGIEHGAADVQIVWRADIGAGDLKEGELPKLQSILDLVRPSSLEALSVPLWAARQWLGRVHSRRQESDVSLPSFAPLLSDVEGAAEPETEPGPVALALAWQGSTLSLITEPHDLRPNAIVVVPSAYGGVDPEFACWNPESTSAVIDRGDEAQLLQKGRAMLRWHPAVIRGWAGSLHADVLSGPKVTPEEVDERGASAERDAYLEWRARMLLAEDLPDWAQVALTHLDKRSTTARLKLARKSEEPEVTWRAQATKVLVPRRVLRELLRLPELRHAPIVAGSSEPATEGDEGSFPGSPFSLQKHLIGVRDFARHFGEALGLPSELTHDLALAGWLHDLGKADPRFQLMLHGGDPVREAAAPELLAKSAITATNREARDHAQERSGYPKGMRHELLSIALVEKESAIAERAHDWNLVLHLVASHHGWCRPFSPPVLDPEPQEVSVDFDGVRLTSCSDHHLQRFDSAISERFWRLSRHYGYWGLAWLEAVLRLADHRESEREFADGGTR
jgi:CRISPR-associated endonuclease/helicase Cas3